MYFTRYLLGKKKEGEGKKKVGWSKLVWVAVTLLGVVYAIAFAITMLEATSGVGR